MHSLRLTYLAAAISWMAIPAEALAQSYASPVTVITDLSSAINLAATSMSMTGVGSGTNGPQTAQFGVNGGCSKDAWPSVQTEKAGYLACVNVQLYQGGSQSDAQGIVINTENTGTGFTDGIEMIASELNPSTYAIPYQIDIQLANITSDQYVAGAAINLLNGTGAAGISVKSEGSASWAYLLQALSDGKAYFTIDGKGNITTQGWIWTPGTVKTNSIKAASMLVAPLSRSQVIEGKNCGTTMRSVGGGPHTLIVPPGLPVGCRIDVMQADSGIISFQGRSMQVEHLGSAKQSNLQTEGKDSVAELLIDSSKTFLLRGNVGDAGLSKVSFDRPAEITRTGRTAVYE